MSKNKNTMPWKSPLDRDIYYYLDDELNWKGLKKLAEHFNLDWYDVGELIIKTYSPKISWDHYKLAHRIYDNLDSIKKGKCNLSRKPDERDIHLAIRMDKDIINSLWKKLGRGGNLYRGVKEFYIKFSEFRISDQMNKEAMANTAAEMRKKQARSKKKLSIPKIKN
mgnify:FL=1|jgi:hypothetical protein